ncbi:thioredoxin domain-containing protein [Streptosporangium sp. NBC_01755]|uniref:thioredoxin domain-containing protein n=1 Tax=unclassified Streptosporangium TaxID=2632669 RepID=UPI002DD7F095|nr:MULTISPECIES: thioredoxin domain-containing protein [unclassified Streptosporangium]WSA26114.1 thioredoxin domain-containing protein [Streptosporangium sp. NBC_01810]WSD02456.1 thioredoxin domain-containing protein [Streptosporangium sp. NBC_01755]
MNRLKDATSPYLLQHADNPVDWFAWGDEAFAEAERRDVPLLISIGYSACHWCHVMAHESFEDPGTAALMNERFVNVKVDREERPDVDAVYMTATQAMTGQGGWPMTVFATPQGHPFYTGTYFPRQQFQRLLAGVSNAWTGDREAVLEQSSKIVEALNERSAMPAGPLPTPSTLTRAVQSLAESFDSARGGFGGAPKFPPSMVLEFLLRYGAAAGGEDARTTANAAMSMADRTLEAMARGGIYDRLGGGFARYSVDADWVVPHFEKMLYDNALLLRIYTHWWRSSGSVLGRRVALETADWLLAEMRTPEGGFASALDADSEGVEGKFYVWTPEELREVLGEEDGAWAIDLFEVTGTFEHGASVLQLLADPDDPERFARVRSALLAARARRVRPGRDDKVVAAWNGLAIAALAETGALFDRPDLVEAAREAASLIDGLHLDGDRLLRTSRDGRAGTNAGVLEDYADLAEGLLTLFGVTGEVRWFRRAESLLEAVLERFPDGSGGFYDTADDAERLFQRPQDPTDNATPSGQFAAAGALLSYAALTGSSRHRVAAEAALGTVTVLADKHARFAGWGLAVAQAAVAGPIEVAVVGPAGDPATAALHRAALMSPLPGLVLALGEPDSGEVPLLAGRGLVGGGPAAYVCRGFTCQMPVTTPMALRAELASEA